MTIEESRKLRLYREMSPCQGCAEKFCACHDRCPKDERGEYGYKAWKEELAAIKKRKKAYDDLNRRRKWQR